MLSSLVAAWRGLLKRLASDWLILAAAVVTVSLATILLASGPIYADAVTLSALQRSIADAPVTDSYVSVGQRTPPDLYNTADRIAVETITEAFATTGTEIRRVIETESFGLATQLESEKIDLVAFQFFEEVDSHAALIKGSWPREGRSSPIEVALPAPTAEILNLDIGDGLSVFARRDPSVTAVITVTGIYQVNDTADPYWFDDQLAIHGVVETTAFRTLGPFLVSLQSIGTDLAPGRLTASWRTLPHYENLTVAEVPQLRRSVSTLETELNAAYGSTVQTDSGEGSDFWVDSGLPILLSATERSLTVTRSSVLALLIQLAILAGYALVLTAGLLVGARRGETHLLRSRGASPGQIGTTAVFEGIVLTLPAALAAPWLASRAIELLDTFGPLSSIGLTIEPVPTSTAYVLSGLAALGAVVALSWPAFRAAKSFPDSAYEPRQLARTEAQRAGVDIALLALAVIVLWQLQAVGPQIGATVQGRFGVDPLLLIAPAIGLLTGAVLALRVIPLMGRVAERVASSGRQTITALAAWQVSRRPLRYSRSALLLIMAIGIGFFAASFSTTWLDSQADQAEFQVGADIRVSPNRRINDSIPDLNLASGHEVADDISISMPLLRSSTQLARSGNLGQFVYLGAKRAIDVVQVREDLAPDFDSLMTELVARRPTLAHVALPGEPTKVGVAISATEEGSVPPIFLGPNHNPGFDLRVSAVIQDGDGLLHKVGLGSIPIGVGPVRLEGDLDYVLSDGTVARPRFPVTLIDIEILSPIPVRSHQVTVEVKGVLATDDTGDWHIVDAGLEVANWGLSQSAARFESAADIAFSEEQPRRGFALDIDTGAALSGISPPLYFSIRPRGTSLPETFPIVVSEAFLESNAVEVGDTIRVSSFRIQNDEVDLIGSVNRFPTVDGESAETVIVDLPTFQMMSYGPGVRLDRITEYWISTTGDDDEEVELLLRGPQYQSVRVVGLESRTASLSSDPVALGTIGALALGFVAAAVFATVGFGVSATVSARERVKEFGLLRALGLSAKQLAGWLSLEQGALVLISLALGTLVGAVLTALVLPLVSLTQQGALVIPEIVIVFPWSIVLQLELAVLGILALMVIAMTILVRRLGLASLLRLGDD